MELWANEGKFDSYAEQDIEDLTREEILYKINNQQMRQVHPIPYCGIY